MATALCNVIFGRSLAGGEGKYETGIVRYRSAKSPKFDSRWTFSGYICILLYGVTQRHARHVPKFSNEHLLAYPPCKHGISHTEQQCMDTWSMILPCFVTVNRVFSQVFSGFSHGSRS